jgi:hypothetical protein
MAFDAAGLTLIGGASNANLWFYTTTDAIATVNTSGYFNSASNMLAVRDVVIVADTSTPTTNLVSILSNASGVVDVSDGTAIAETDTD